MIMKLTRKDIDKLWGEEGPYSEAQLIIETRILDDRVSRIFVLVEIHINPFTFEMIHKNRELFANDPLIQQLLDHSEFRGQAFGYVSCAFQEEYTDREVMEKAKQNLEYSKKAIIKMHKFVMSLLKEKVIN